MNAHLERSLRLNSDLLNWDMVLKENEEIIKRFGMTEKEYQDELERRHDDGR